jgi:predicted nucleotide-binding protein
MAKSKNFDRGGERATSDFPKHTLQSAMRLAMAIEETNGGRPLPPTDLAIALSLSPGSSDYRILLSSSLRYGLTVGSYKNERIELTELGRQLASPTGDNESLEARRNAFLGPSTFRQIYDSFRGKKLPEDNFFENAVVRDFGVPREHASKCVKIFRENAEFVGLLRRASTGLWLASDAIALSQIEPDAFASSESDSTEPVSKIDGNSVATRSSDLSAIDEINGRLDRVFVTHGRNKELIPQLKELLAFGKLIPVVSVERETVSKPVPDKVLDDMRGCGAAIIHVDAERRLVDPESGEPVIVLNPNVLIEIGAAMALYSRRFILLVQKGVQLPSNLLGLYEVRYEGDRLDGEATLKLLKAFNDIRNYPLVKTSSP